MKFRLTASWIALISAGTLCLAVGAVRFPPRSRTDSLRSATKPKNQPATDISVIPMQANTSTGTTATRPYGSPAEAVLSQRVQAVNYKQQALSGSQISAQETEGRLPLAARASNAYQQRLNGYQEPELWPYRKSSTSQSTQLNSHQSVVGQRTATGSSQIADWPHRPPISHTGDHAGTARHNDARPVLRPQHTESPQQHAASQELLNPELSFGSGPHRQASVRAESSKFDRSQTNPETIPVGTIQQQQTSQSAAFSEVPIWPALNGETASSHANTSLLVSNQAPMRSQSHQARLKLPVPELPQPSLKDLPAPELPQEQTSIVQETGHTDIHRLVRQANAASVTPRDNVTVGQWAAPEKRPVQSIRKVSFEACPECEDVERIPAESLLNPYQARAGEYPNSAAPQRESGQLVELPATYAPWWDEIINKPMRLSPSTHVVNVESLILSAIEHSPQVTAFRIDPIVRETQILEEAAAFDWQSFIETKYDDINDPIGNSLTTGDNSDRFTDHNLSSRLGLEKRMAQGGKLDVSQKFGYQDNNSTFFTPTQQGTSRLELNFTQPLLRGAGQTYNESRTVLAMLDHQVSEDELQNNLQDHLLEVYRTYWSLYRSRAVRLQKERLLRRAIDIEQRLTARQGIDAVKRQVLRARAAVASRQSEIVRANMEIRNAESRLRLLVNGPNLKQDARVELLPDEAPMSEYLTVSMRGSIETALQNRPDIRRAIALMKETAVRLEVSKNELLPKLDLVLGTYVAGLRGEGEVETAWVDQFRDGRPGYSVGLMLQYPLGNRAGKARYARREWEVARTLKEFEASVESSMSEVELAVREFETSYQEMLSRFQAMIAADTEANYLLERWQLLPGNDQTTSFLLEDLLDAQERVAMEEQDFVDAQVAYVLSIVLLKKASGILLNCDCDNSPVSFMTPATRNRVAPEELPAPQEPRPLPPEQTVPKLMPPLPALPAAQQPTTDERKQPLNQTPPGVSSESGPAIIPLPGLSR